MFEIRPTPQEVVQFKKFAEEQMHDYKGMVSSVQFAIDHTTDVEELKELQEDLVSYQASMVTQRNIMLSDINLSETKLEGSIVVLSVVSSLKHTVKHMFDEKDIIHNRFAYVGEFKGSPHHIMVVGMKTGKNYCMVHSNLFLIEME